MPKQNNLESRKAKLIELCKDFDQQASAAVPIDTLVELLNIALEDEGLAPKFVREATYRVTKIITFISSLHETVEGINRLESLIEKS